MTDCEVADSLMTTKPAHRIKPVLLYLACASDPRPTIKPINLTKRGREERHRGTQGAEARGAKSSQADRRGQRTAHTQERRRRTPGARAGGRRMARQTQGERQGEGRGIPRAEPLTGNETQIVRDQGSQRVMLLETGIGSPYSQQVKACRLAVCR